MPTRQADSGVGGTLTRDRLALILQERGLYFREAQKVVHVVLDSMIQRLRQGERITVPKLGTFLIKDQPKQYQRRRFGRRQTVFRQRTRVAFRPTKALRILLENLREPATAVAQRKDKRHACEKCGSTMFEEGEFRQYTQQSCSTPGKDLKPITEGLPMRAAICICGHPARQERMRRPLRGDQASFEKSFAMAVRRRELADSQLITEGLSAVLAEKARQSDLAGRISLMQRIVQKLSEAVKSIHRESSGR